MTERPKRSSEFNYRGKKITWGQPDVSIRRDWGLWFVSFDSKDTYYIDPRKFDRRDIDEKWIRKFIDDNGFDHDNWKKLSNVSPLKVMINVTIQTLSGLIR